MTDSVNVLERQEMKQPRRSTILARAVVITAAALLGGCANVHHVAVGSVPVARVSSVGRTEGRPR